MSSDSPSFRSKLALLVLCAALAGCAALSSRTPGPREQPPIAAGEANEETVIATALSQVERTKGEYRIETLDLLEINVYQESTMNQKVRVTQSGTISFPLIGAVNVKGLTISEAQESIREKLKQFLVDPQISVFIVEYHEKKVYILGEVKEPGPYRFPSELGLSVVEAVTMAKGFTPIAAPNRTKVIRNSEKGTVSITVPVSDIYGGDKSKDIALQANDVIYVPQSYF